MKLIVSSCFYSFFQCYLILIYTKLTGEADFETSDGGKEVYNIKVDFRKQIVQLTFISQTHGINNRKRRDTDEDSPPMNFTKTVIQDYRNVCKLQTSVFFYESIYMNLYYPV